MVDKVYHVLTEIPTK